MSTMSGTNAWLQRQRKSDLVEIAEHVGLQGYVIFALNLSSRLFGLKMRADTAWDLPPRRCGASFRVARDATEEANGRDCSLTFMRPHSYEGQKKADLEVTLDEFLSEHADKLANEPKVAPYFNSRARAAGSPTKKDAPKLDVKEGLRVVKRRATRTASEVLGAE